MKRILTLITAIVLYFQFLGAQSYATRQLEYLAGLLKCSLPQHTDTFHCQQVKKLLIVIEYDNENKVSHLGIKLFPDSIKNHSLTKPLYDFQERLFLEVFLQDEETNARKLLKENDVHYLDFSLSLGAGTFFSSLENSLRLASMDSVEYVMTKDSLTWTSEWSGKTGNFMLRFPANYDLISGMDKKEIEACFAKQLQLFKCNGISAPSLKGDFGDLQQLNRSTFVLRGNSLSVAARNNNVYLGILYDRNYPEESIANLFNYPDPQRTKGLDLQISQIVYGGDSLNYRLNLYDLQCFMGNDYDVFTGIAKCSVDTIEFSVIYKSKWYNCEHLLIVKTTPQILFDKTESLKAAFYTFIPNQNIKNLYKEYTTGNRNILWK